MKQYDQTTQIEGEVFEKMREDTNKVIQTLIRNMIDKQTYNGSIAIKIDMELVAEYIPIPPDQVTEESGDTRMVLKPHIEHKVTSAMQIKHEEKGKYNSDLFCLVWDDAEQAYVLTPIKGGDQMNIFDVMDADVTDVDEDSYDDSSLAADRRLLLTDEKTDDYEYDSPE